MSLPSLEFVDPKAYGQAMVCRFKAGSDLVESRAREVLDEQQLSKNNTTEILRVEVSESIWETKSLILKGLGNDWPQLSPAIKSMSAWDYLRSKELPTWENAGLVTIDRKKLYFATPDLLGDFDQVLSLPADDVPGLTTIADKIDWEGFEESCQDIVGQLRAKLSASSEIEIEYNTWMFGLKLEGEVCSITSWIGDIDKIYPEERTSSAAEAERDFRMAVEFLLKDLQVNKALNF